MTGLSAQLDFIRRIYPDLETIWVTSHKCSNFNAFEQIPFIVAGNQRNWIQIEGQEMAEKQHRPIYTAPRSLHKNNAPRSFTVNKWIFTEAQCGKDQLDCHFSWIRNCFDTYLQGKGNNLTHPRDMFKALTAEAFNITNTHVLWGDTSHDPVTTKFPLKLAVHSVHEYVYNYMPTKDWEVTVAHHGGILTTTTKTRHAFKTGGKWYIDWLNKSSFSPTSWTCKGIHVCRPEKMVLHSGKQNPQMTRQRKRINGGLSEYFKDIVKFAYEWSCVDYEDYRSDVELTSRREEYAATRNIGVNTKGWAKKRQPPPTRIPMSVKQDLIPLFNSRPFLSAEQCRVKIMAMERYQNNVYVEYFVTAPKIKQYFQTLLSYRKVNNLSVNTPLGEDAAGCDSADTLDRYNNLFHLDELQLEVQKRGLSTVANPSKAQLVQTLLDHDVVLNKGRTDNNTNNTYHQWDIDELRIEVQKREMALPDVWNASTADLIQVLMDNDKDVEEGRTEEDVEMAYSLHEHVSGALDMEIEEISREEDMTSENEAGVLDMEICDDEEDIEIIDNLQIRTDY